MKILYLSARQPWPTVSGAKLRDYNLARSLGQSGQLTYVFYKEKPGAAFTAADFPFCHQVVAIPRPSTYTPLKVARGLTGKWPLPILNYTSPQMIEAVLKILGEQVFDVVHVDLMQLMAVEAAIRPHLRGAKVFYNWHNIDSELMYRYTQGDGPWIRRQYAAFTAKALAKAETLLLQTADGHIVCSEREQKILLQQQPQAHIAVVENGVDAPFFSALPPAVERTRLVFVGSMGYHANVDAAVWFTHQIWPQLRARFPKLRLTLVGSDPTAAVRELQNQPGVEVTGTVPDVRPYYQEAVAALVPLRVGGGTRLKILEAMAAGVPVISTAIGAEGLAVSPGLDILFAESPEEWAAALAEVQQDGRALALARAGQDLIRRRYDWAVIGRGLVQTYREWAGVSA